MQIYNLEHCPFSYKNGSYGGASGDKNGIIFKEEPWLVKYPKNITEMQNTGGASYSTSPLSEYIGSHIYSILGIDVHETELGIRKGKVVVACKDFATDDILLEIRTLKNVENEELTERFGQSFENTGDKHCVDIDSLLTHLQYNSVLSIVDGIKERFWKQAVIDIFINNNDRNNGNWGILRSKNEPDRLAPVFDNGGCLQTKISEDKAVKILQDKESARKNAVNTQTAYGRDGHILSSIKFLNLQNEYPELLDAIIAIVPLIQEKMTEIKELFNQIPERTYTEDGRKIPVLPPAYKELFILQLEERLDKLLIPAYEHAMKLQKEQSVKGIDDIIEEAKEKAKQNNTTKSSSHSHDHEER